MSVALGILFPAAGELPFRDIAGSAVHMALIFDSAAGQALGHIVADCLVMGMPRRLFQTAA